MFLSQWLKCILKKLLPAPAESFHSRMEMQQGMIEKMQQQNAVLSNQLQKLSTALEQQEQELASLGRQEQKISSAFIQQEQKISSVLVQQEQERAALGRQEQKLTAEIVTNRELEQAAREEIRDKVWFYQSNLEYRYYKDAFSNGLRNIPNFEKRFLRLVKGMDHDSVETVVKILNRMETLYRQGTKRLDLFTKEEQQKLWELRDRFSGNRFQISDSLFYYQGYFLPFNQFEACVFYYRHGLELVRNQDSLRGRDIIDAGGFIGDSALIFSPLTAKKVYSFEPAPENYTLMMETIRLNNLSNVVPVQMALSSKNEKLNFNVSGSCSNGFANSTFQYSGQVEVDAITLDDYVEEHSLDVGLIKTDLEGAEQAFLEGAMRTIKRCKPVLLISIYHNIDDFLDIKPMLEDLNLGYRFQISKPLDGSIMLESMLIAEVE